MIKLKNGERTMEARTELQASAFINSGWERVDAVEREKGISDESVEEPENCKKKYTKTEISRMKTENLRALAAEVGITVTEEATGAELKDALIEHFGL